MHKRRLFSTDMRSVRTMTSNTDTTRPSSSNVKGVPCRHVLCVVGAAGGGSLVDFVAGGAGAADAGCWAR